MNPQIPLLGCFAFAFWLCRRDVKTNARSVSPALWLPVLWLAIIASRPVSAWLGSGGEGADSDGDSLDRNIFLALIALGVFVLGRRRVQLTTVIRNNKWLFLFYLFFLVSVVWSPDPLVSGKRWIKDLGHVIMVLVAMTENDPIQAVRSLFLRCAYLLIPLSFVLIRYYPGIGTVYSVFTGEVHYQGVTLGKNLLGATILVLTLFLIWEVTTLVRDANWKKRKLLLLSHGGLSLLGFWLLRLSNSATSLACALLGSVAVIGLSMDFVRARLKNLIGYSIAGALALVLLSMTVDLGSGAAGMLGRDSSLTGRDVIWRAVLEEKTNPIIGTGFYSFWMGDRADKMCDRYKYHFKLNQAHNGYLETYLNGGAIGLALLLGMLLAAGWTIKSKLLLDPGWQGLRLVFWGIIVVHNWSEATFTRLSPLWFALLAVVVEYPLRVRKANRKTATTGAQERLETDSPVSQGQSVPVGSVAN